MPSYGALSAETDAPQSYKYAAPTGLLRKRSVGLHLLTPLSPCQEIEKVLARSLSMT
ncbi:Uncharacterized protein dnm_043380 [Desulfonema magnum]|uniref:Uncharacterized protein n=1 Tax=Desulfonema magnum TaxID=45655 RepID=A0A975BMR1_9BACT|nr:Uncharacterized protein dnm_043380 [Desulfonema magnum]